MEARCNFCLSSAIDEATRILIKYPLDNDIKKSNRELIKIMVDKDPRKMPYSKGRDFLTKMAALAWDFLNVSNILPQT